MKAALIDLVFDTPAIWDKRHKQHHNRHVLSKQWKEIARRLRTTEKEARNCWKNLRQEFKRQLKKTDVQSGDGASEEIDSQWPYFQKMLFLQDQFTPRETSGNLTVGQDNTSDVEYDAHSEDENHVSLAQTIMSPDLDHILRASPTTPGPALLSSSSSCSAACSRHCRTRTGYKRCMTPQAEAENQTLNLEKEKLEMKRSRLYDKNDEDVGFFNSLLPHVKSLSTRDKFIFRMKVQQTLFELVFPKRTEPNSAQTNCYNITARNVHEAQTDCTPELPPSNYQNQDIKASNKLLNGC